MNVAGWRQRAMTARLRGNDFYTLSLSLSPHTADSELAVTFSADCEKSHHKGAVIITPITASQLRARGVGVKEKRK